MQNLPPNGIYILMLTVTKGENSVLITESERHNMVLGRNRKRTYTTSRCLVGCDEVMVSQGSVSPSQPGPSTIPLPSNPSIALRPFFSASHAFSAYVLWDRSFDLWRWNASKICVVFCNLRGNRQPYCYLRLSKNLLISYYVTFSFFIHLSTDLSWIFITKQCWVLC